MNQIVTANAPLKIAEPLVFHEEELTESTLPGKFVTVLSVVDIVLIFLIILTLALIKDRKINQERHPIFLPYRPPRGFRLYAVLLETGQSPAGGTSAKVFLRIIGKLTKTPGFTLVCTTRQRRYGSKHLFGSQNKDIFILSVPHYLGRIESFEVMTDRRGDSPPWFLRSVRVMSLNNRKCWKSDVSAWLRGDKKPYTIKASLIGALSTKDYFLKVFLQSHLWTAPWYRILGSSLMSGHRALTLWISVGCSIWINHYFLYDQRLLENIRENRVVTEQYTVHDVARAASLSSLGGVLLATIFRQLLVLLTGGTKWQRLDDKDDLCHLMKPGALEYAHGAVVRRITIKAADEYVSLTDLQHLTQEQRRAIKHMTECKISNCSLKKIINEPVCAPRKNCCYSRDGVTTYIPNTASEAFQQPFESMPQQREQYIEPRISVPLEKGKSADTDLCSCDENQSEFSPDFADLCECEPRLVCSENIRKRPQVDNSLECCFDRKVSSCGNFFRPSCGSVNSNENSETTETSKPSGKKIDKEKNKSKKSRSSQNPLFNFSQTLLRRNKGLPVKNTASSVYNTPYSSAPTSLTDERKIKNPKHILSTSEYIAPDVSAHSPLKNKSNNPKRNGQNTTNQKTAPVPKLQKYLNKSNITSISNSDPQNFVQDLPSTKKHKNLSKSRPQGKYCVPHVSARTESSTSDLFVDAFTNHDWLRKHPLGDQFDSVSEAESDQEIVTKSARTDSEINLIKRPAQVYNSAPQWHDKYHVWTEAQTGGSQHHIRLNRRYDFAIGSGDIINLNHLSKLEQSIHSYLLEEQSVPAGVVKLPNTYFASFFAVLLALGALFISCYAVYERFFISNGDTLIFLYALIFSVLLNLLLFSTIAAVICSLFASYKRRNRILLRREKNATSY